jgi:feruloyl-CoA synthase
MTLGALTAGVPVAPVSVAYSLQSKDHARVRAIAQLIAPGAVYADDAAAFGSALDALGGVPAIVGAGSRAGAETLAGVRATVPGPAVRGAFGTLTPDVTAKVWGATETAPAVTSANFPHPDARCIGAPLPGALVKLVPVEDAYEIRVQGPNVTPGYFARPDLTAAAFDADGFYRTGDAAGFTVPGDPDAGLVFRGRIAEDFKLSTGTFVRVGAVRTALLSSVPVLSDAVIAGENRDYPAALAWLNPAEARALLGRDPDPADGGLITDQGLLRLVAAALARHNESHGSAAGVGRLLIMARPASLDAGEVTDEGYVNQRKVLAGRAALVELLYTGPAPPGVIVPARY